MSLRKELTLLVVLTGALAANSCRDRDEHREGSEYRKTAEDDFQHTRTEFSATARDRLKRLDEEIRGLRARGSEKARRAADELHAERDRLAPKVDEVGRHAKEGWEQFKTDVSAGLDDLQRKLDAAVND